MQEQARPIGIVVHGPSSAGKTSLADAVQQLDERLWLTVRADQLDVFPCQRAEFVTADNDRRLREGVMRTAVGFLDLGFNVINEQFIADPVGGALARRVLGAAGFLAVQLRCDLATAEEREARRAGLYPGVARQQAAEIERRPSIADLLLDTTTAAPAELAATVIDWLASGPTATALRLD